MMGRTQRLERLITAIKVNRFRWIKGLSFLTAFIFSCSIMAGCAPTQSNYEGAGVGGAIGAAAGALLDRSNPWRGAVIGGALGAVAGGTMAEISKRAAMEARDQGRPVVYERRTSEGGWQKVEATPTNRYNGTKRCVSVKTYENGHLVDETMNCD
ncbi:MAG: YMGG-like glycine zipper-containing protein [Dissulfurimicrobium sp.]|uniref:YMGG-like glycine zipper-containing protein n=1 Tax=Dissulfurimicrobium TaxID=1769732 RepID=UPI001EDAFD73|nr:YMGG-like glycine zipper-containing protein [Dissulfurimicrobium hydrothermale]UKL13104.1 glycine zipper 2TM domain-containing protein [Dissulfurimicrobium hydrothermale]